MNRGRDTNKNGVLTTSIFRGGGVFHALKMVSTLDPVVFQVGGVKSCYILIISLSSYFSVNPLEKPLCGMCKNNITMFCVQCKHFV